MCGIHLGLMMLVDPKARPGLYREVDSAVYTDQGQETFHPCPPKHIEREMTSLLEWTNKSAPALHPAVAATLLFHEFESIHPFLDGNGRVGRTLFHLYLQQHGLPNAHLCMVEKELTKDPGLYYQLLGWTDQKASYTELLDHFTDALVNSYESALVRFTDKDLLSSELPETSKRLVVAARHKDWFSVGEAARWVGGVGEQTIRNRLNELVGIGVLEARGQTRSRRYRFKHPLEELRRIVSGINTKVLEELKRRGLVPSPDAPGAP
jgi:Fic family protein